jgi:hypothetical protein
MNITWTGTRGILSVVGVIRVWASCRNVQQRGRAGVHVSIRGRVPAKFDVHWENGCEEPRLNSQCQLVPPLNCNQTFRH